MKLFNKNKDGDPTKPRKAFAGSPESSRWNPLTGSGNVPMANMESVAAEKHSSNKEASRGN